MMITDKFRRSLSMIICVGIMSMYLCIYCTCSCSCPCPCTYLVSSPPYLRRRSVSSTVLRAIACCTSASSQPSFCSTAFARLLFPLPHSPAREQEQESEYNSLINASYSNQDQSVTRSCKGMRCETWSEQYKCTTKSIVRKLNRELESTVHKVIDIASCAGRVWGWRSGRVGSSRSEHFMVLWSNDGHKRCLQLSNRTSDCTARRGAVLRFRSISQQLCQVVPVIVAAILCLIWVGLGWTHRGARS